MVTINLNAPQTSSMSDRKKIIGPTTLYKGKKLAPHNVNEGPLGGRA
jgi:hypothetical protein